MPILKKPDWSKPDREATDEDVYLNRRRILTAMGIGGAILAAPFAWRGMQGILPEPAPIAPPEPDPSAGLYPVERNTAFTLDRELTPEKDAITYNNFYEFGSHKSISSAAQALRIRPWQVQLDGLVEKNQTIEIDDLLAKMPLEERLYRHRCVEAWSMAVPWSGFALRALVDQAKPLGSAKYVVMETFHDPEMAPGQGASWYPWPYVEGLTIEEATNDLAFIATGLYGKPIPRQNGSPLRLAVPWKYGFKSIKSIVRFTFTETRPKTFWETVQAVEYGFWANVNPEVSHPRWSQATERVLGTNERVPTLLYNGYADQVAHLYKDLQDERLFA
ncbi:MAG: protein-methionine-sulfoxide reductase catalytic subunit MsrP [Geminicoccaceae bacterium]